MALFNLSQALRKDKSSGRPLRTVFKALTNVTAVFRRGQLVMIGAGPGVGKSIFALTVAVQSEAKTVYFSADSGPGTQLSRTVSLTSGKPVSEVLHHMEKGALFENELVDVQRIRWDFNAGPSLDDIQSGVDAYAYLHGEYPEVIVVDNLLNVDVGDAEGGYKTQENILLFLLELARTTGACVLVLHHLTGEYEDGTKPPPLSSFRDKVGKVVEMALTLFRIDDGMSESLGVCIVKNRGGRAKADGSFYVELEMDLSSMSIKDPDGPVTTGPVFN